MVAFITAIISSERERCGKRKYGTLHCLLIHGKHYTCLAHYGWRIMSLILQATILKAYSCMEIVAFWFRFRESVSPRIQITMAAEDTICHYLNHWWHSLLATINYDIILIGYLSHHLFHIYQYCNSHAVKNYITNVSYRTHAPKLKVCSFGSCQLSDMYIKRVSGPHSQTIKCQAILTFPCP